MTIDWNAFTPFAALAGGALVGAAAAMLLAFNGRIAGISGIIGSLRQAPRGDRAWRLAFVAGLLAAPLLWGAFFTLPTVVLETSPLMLVMAGLLVGYGTRLGSGCTSGHGVCGLARLSPRSMVATAGFMAAGFIVVYFVRHVWGGA